MQEPLAPEGRAGADVGKGQPWVCLVGGGGTTNWSSKIVNDESAILYEVYEPAPADQGPVRPGVSCSTSGTTSAIESTTRVGR